MLSPTVLQSFTGVYEPAPENAEAGLLIVTLKEGALFINRFWPTGCRLVPEGATDFRLAAASRPPIVPEYGPQALARFATPG
jgi:hypothetical protein